MLLITIASLSACAGTGDQLFLEDGYKSVNGVDHYYKILGQGEPFILLHGGPGMYHDELYPYFIDFAKKNQVIFYDQRGNGKSALDGVNATNFTTDILVDDLEGLRQAFGIEKLNIIGHSWGGLLSMHYAARYPEHVKRLITISSAPVNTALLVASYRKHVSRFAPEEWQHLEELWSSDAYKAGDPDVHNEAMRMSEGRTFYDKSFVDEYMSVAAFTEVTAKNAVTLEDQSRQMKFNITLQETIGNIIAPTLMIQGREDFIVEEAPVLACGLIQNCELVWIEQSGHYPYIEKKGEFFNILNEFIGETQ